MASQTRTAQTCAMDDSTRLTRSSASQIETRTNAAEALQDAARILERAEADEAAANAARDLYRVQPMAALRPDAQIGPMLDMDEAVLAARPHAMVERRAGPPRTEAARGLGGSLYVTSRRLVLVGRNTLWFDLDGIKEVLLTGERLLLVMQDGKGAALSVAQPRLLRVEMAAARQSARG